MSNYDIDLIKVLKQNNWTPYGGWTLNIRTMAHKIGIANFVKRVPLPDEWHQAFGEFDDFAIYRLRPDYEVPEEKPEIVERGIYPNESELCIDDGGEPTSIHTLISSTRFVGFRAGDYVYGRIYRHKKTKSEVLMVRYDMLDEYEVLTPTHCLFQVTK